jgi:hypothetical protein
MGVKFIVGDRFFDSTACLTYYEGQTYEVEGEVLKRLAGHIERHATVIEGTLKAPFEDDLTEKSKAELLEIAEDLGITVAANDNKATIADKIRAVR